MPLGAFLGATDDKRPVSEGGERCPDLLAIDLPLLPGGRVDEGCTCAYIGEVAAGVGFRIALAPELFAASDGQQEAGFLLGGTKRENGGASEFNTHVAHAPRRTGPRIFFSKDDLFGQVRTTATELFRPADGTEAFTTQRLFPFHAPLEHGHLAHHATDIAERASKLRL